jgi:carbon storage regulator CsrA
MLVLSRKEKQRVIFPNLDIAVEILRVAGQTVRVGIEAPDDVQILRAELVEGEMRERYEQKQRDEAAERHAFRNQLNSATMALCLLQKQLELGKLEDADATLRQALEALTELNESTGSSSSTSLSSSNGKPHPQAKGPRALVVEDNDNERELMAGFLRLSGYNVDTVEDGLAAIDYLTERETPDVVLIDINMPRMDGETAVKVIRENTRHRNLKLFAVTGTDRSSVDIEIGSNGVDRWFTKPLKPTEFVDALEAELARN